MLQAAWTHEWIKNELNMDNISETNWNMIDLLTDEYIDKVKVSPLDENFFAKSKLYNISCLSNQT